jgi:hypothetical protein
VACNIGDIKSKRSKGTDLRKNVRTQRGRERERVLIVFFHGSKRFLGCTGARAKTNSFRA